MKTHSKFAGAVLLSLLFIVSCEDQTDNAIPKAPEEIDLANSIYFHINLDDRSDDTFKVRMFVDGLTTENAVIQFPATTPGTYDIHDIGRFVVNFKAFDVNHSEVGVTHTSTNQWLLADPANTHIIEYEVKETFDTPVTQNTIYRMAGTSIEKSHALLNTFDVLCYPTGLKEHDFYLSIDYPSGWSVGTSLLKDENGFYHAVDFDKFVDNPLLLGFITTHTRQVSNTTINVFTYSEKNVIHSSEIFTDIEQIILDAEAFLEELPVDRYSFLFHFEQIITVGTGALEHSYSSVYSLRDQPYTVNYGISIRNIAAHEFFHIVTPLNIHSEIIENFNFAEPTPSEHLWLYEGVTEWASHMMQFRNGTIAIPTLLSRLSTKKLIADDYNKPAKNGPMSLSEMSLTCYGEGGGQFGNVYQKGALVAALLDIRLLELSGGTKGLREIILQLINTYGPENAFSEENFFNDLATLTGYPTEVTEFLNKYVKGTDDLPMKEYFAKLGITYIDDKNNVNYNTFSIDASPTAEQLTLRQKWSINF